MDIRLNDKVKITDSFYNGIVGRVVDYEAWETRGLFGYLAGNWYKFIVKINEGTPEERNITVREDELMKI